MANCEIFGNSVLRKFSFIALLIGLIFQRVVCEDNILQCGNTDFATPLVVGGNDTFRGQWPFLAAIFQANQSKFFCGGSLISTKHVLTAAHCFKGKYSSEEFLPGDVIVRLGAHDLTIAHEKDVIHRTVKEIHVHPEWDVYDDQYDADIAILVLSENVTLTNYIRTVCMPTDDEKTDGTTGSIVGWGSVANQTGPHLGFPKHATTHALNISYCHDKDPFIAFISSSRTFCGGAGDGSPNRGDSGGGFFMRSQSAWVQYGIISSIHSTSTGRIDSNSFAVYTRVKDFKNWINETTGGVMMTVGDAYKIINFSCNYKFGDSIYIMNPDRQTFIYNYPCTVHDLDLRSEHFKISFAFSHLVGQTNEDVKVVEFWNGTMFFVPEGIGNTFKNLESFWVSSNGLKYLKRSNFKDMKNVYYLRIDNSDIESLDEYTFWDLPNLSTLNFFQNNKLKYLQERTFEKNVKLRTINFDNNQLKYLPEDLFKNNLLLDLISFNNNSLKFIDVDFSELQNNPRIYFAHNDCINAKYDAWHQNLTAFMNSVKANCSSVKGFSNDNVNWSANFIKAATERNSWSYFAPIYNKSSQEPLDFFN